VGATQCRLSTIPSATELLQQLPPTGVEFRRQTLLLTQRPCHSGGRLNHYRQGNSETRIVQSRSESIALARPQACSQASSRLPPACCARQGQIKFWLTPDSNSAANSMALPLSWSYLGTQTLWICQDILTYPTYPNLSPT
jgi:hypothetical protein